MHLNVLEIVVSHQVDDLIEDDILCRTDVDPTIVKRPVVCHVTNDFIDDVDEHLSHASDDNELYIMSSSYPHNNFLETNAMFLEFADNLDNLTEGSSLMGENSASGHIQMMIAPGAENSIFSYVVRFSQQFFVFDFNDQAMNRFVKHQMLSTFKEFWGDYHRHFKKYDDPEEEQSRANKAARQKSSLTIIAARQSRFYNNSMSSLSKEGSRSIVRSCFRKHTFNLGQGNQPLSEDEICDQVLGRQPSYSKGLGLRSKPKARKTTSASSSSTSCSQST
ncbi:CACTA en-spm transposon protein [Cucumis melo var. makuwa]|uniref:CACTA en-spm transposon protein n=1 Tax=Cucumis melo var. makuwa TaxID=1194695 RepID=A0A5A7TPU4_CUCMM|nr:CACTA en-spm transposon protein [Cucumis melo var. makuwa]TYK16552.1 CACTA en-spm transposon protein [Cucumis melo var. makuwa]